jgi:hypothetical protein
MTSKDDYVRVTSVLKPFSGLHKVPADILKKAAERGNLVHRVCDALINGLGLLDEVEESIYGYISSFEQWYKEKIFIPKPDRFYCDKYMITGEIDGIYQDGGLVLFDIKTPLKESKTWPLQCSAYAYLARLKGFNIKRIEVIKLSKYGKEPTIYHYEENLDMFLKCLEMYKHFFNKDDEEDFLQCL